MFAKLFGNSRSSEVPQELYGSVVAQARLPVFFTAAGFEDSVTGRFDVLALHLFLFSRRLVREDTSLTKSLNQEVFDCFTDSIDQALRELGIGDTSVPKRKKKLVRGFYALVADLAEPLDEQDIGTIAESLGNRFAGEAGRSGLAGHALATYVLAVSNQLDATPADALLQGRLDWPEAEPYFET